MKPMTTPRDPETENYDDANKPIDSSKTLKRFVKGKIRPKPEVLISK